MLKSSKQLDTGHLISAGDSLKNIEKDWKWIEGNYSPGAPRAKERKPNNFWIVTLYIAENLLPELKALDDPEEKEAFALAKFQSLVASRGNVVYARL